MKLPKFFFSLDVEKAKKDEIYFVSCSLRLKTNKITETVYKGQLTNDKEASKKSKIPIK